MAYADLAKLPGKQAVQIVELHLDFCSRTYGTAPCTATFTGPTPTGTDRCFNTRATCQDKPNWNKTTRIYRFATQRIDGLQAPGDPPVIPTLTGVKSSPTILTPGKGLGVRSSVTATIVDHPFTDVGVDPYFTQRAYTQDDRGSFWGRFITRNAFYQNRRMDVLTGFLNEDGSFDIANFKRRTYIITKITGPSANGGVQIEAKDPLKLADGEKAKWPTPSTTKTATALAASSLNTVEALTISDPDLLMPAWWTTDGQQYIRVDDEIMRIDSITSGLGTPTVVVQVRRGRMPLVYDPYQNPSPEHAADASVQLCRWIDDMMVYDLVYFLLKDVAKLDPAFLPLSDWQTEIDNGFEYLHLSALLAEPKDVKALITELTELGVLIWWDERSQVVRLRGMRFRELIGPQINDDESILRDSFSATEDAGGLVTQAWLYFDRAHPVNDPKLLKSWRVVDVRADLDRESADEYAAPGIREVRSQWIFRENADIARDVNNTILRQYKTVRKVITWAMDPKDDAYWVGDTVGVASRQVQDQFGDAEPRNYLITQVEEVFSGTGIVLKYTATEQFSFVRTGVITHPSGVGVDPIPAPPDYSLASDAEKNQWAFISPDTPAADPRFSDATRAYQII